MHDSILLITAPLVLLPVITCLVVCLVFLLKREQYIYEE